jgi:hypothetical protein
MNFIIEKEKALFIIIQKQEFLKNNTLSIFFFYLHALFIVYPWYFSYFAWSHPRQKGKSSVHV